MKSPKDRTSSLTSDRDDTKGKDSVKNAIAGTLGLIKSGRKDSKRDEKN